MQIEFPAEKKQTLLYWTTFFWQHKERFAMALVVILGGAIFLARNVSGKEGKMGDYLQSFLYQEKLRSQKEVDLNAITRLVKKYPELKPMFSHYLAQLFAIQGDITGVKRVSEDALKRLSFMDPRYRDYAMTSLLIEEGKYEEALMRSVQMRNTLAYQEAPNLYGLNLIRISFLEKLLEKKQKTKWEESLLTQELLRHLKDQTRSLVDFVR